LRTEFVGSIATVREVEDCIRATKKYTKGAFRRPVTHPIQGEGFPSRTLTEYYETYPDLELSWDMSASDAWAWVWGDVAHIDVLFQYDYRANRGKVIVHGNDGVVNILRENIPGFREALARVNNDKWNNNVISNQTITKSPHKQA